MQKTLNYNLNKPDGADFYDVEHFNENADIIDAKLKELEDKAVKATDTVIGLVKPDGKTTSVDKDGALSVVIDDKLSETSENPVQNKVIKKYADDIDNKYSQLSGRNLLLNSDFRVNQRQGKISLKGTTTYSDTDCTIVLGAQLEDVVQLVLMANGNYRFSMNPNIYLKASDVVDGYVGDWTYTVDRWKKIFGIVEILDDGIKLNKNGNPQGALLFQRMENPKNIYGKTITISARINNEIVSATGDIPSVPPTASTTLFFASKDNAFFRVAMQVDGNIDFTLGIFGGTTDICTIYWAKVELGSIATPYEHPDYNEELARCMWHYEKLKYPQGTVLPFWTWLTNVVVPIKLKPKRTNLYTVHLTKARILNITKSVTVENVEFSVLYQTDSELTIIASNIPNVLAGDVGYIDTFEIDIDAEL